MLVINEIFVVFLDRIGLLVEFICNMLNKNYLQNT